MTIKPKTFTIGALLCAMLAVSAEAQPVPVIEPEPLPEPPEEIGAWYLRGDIAYVINSEPNVYFDEDVARQRFGYADIDDTARIGVGVGRRFGDWFRSDLTLDYAVETGLAGGTPGPCGPASCATVERVDLSTLSLMLNGYASLGYFSGISPYVGAGVGFSYLNWDYRAGLDNRSNDDVRFAYALMAGVGYDINSNWTVDAGYRFFNVPKGNIADDNAALNGDIRFEDLMSHEFRLGLRYTFGDFVN
ncbi:MAG TPA: outer membrane protein [Afifellaceae bacterium]|nr:outer membrane protein [Afifellaceae bacterium]